MGAFGYADDLVLLAPSRTAMQLMLKSCEEFAIKYNLEFSTDTNPNKSKSKCLFMCGSSKVKKPLPLQLYGVDLPWVTRATHLGNELSVNGTMEIDTKQKRAAFIDRSLNIREQFKFAHPIEVLKAVKLYCCDHYGAMLWDLQSSSAQQYYNAWNTCVKLTWGVPRQTHRYFVSHLSGSMKTVEQDILERFVGFYRGLLSSPNREVTIMARIAAADIRSNTAKNLRLVETMSGGHTWVSPLGKLKEGLAKKTKVPVPDSDLWRIGMLDKLLEARDVMSYQGLDESLVYSDCLCTT